ncbi:MAG: M20/M25/M40 family metallo-hydrolase [Patescibacteria group bacterium]|nr:M20/M25/M40 family metallo-hydrolase [Patescibacteria group bacterium]
MDKNKIIKKLTEFIKIESVSTDKKRIGQILKAVDFIKSELKSLGFKIQIFEKKDFPPLIIAKKTISSQAKTLGFYAHYDVQPEDPVDKWLSQPFKLTEKNNRFYARGIADDKGHLFQIIQGAKNLIEKNELKNNLVFIFEGEEEIGSVHFEELIKKDKEIKKIDVFYIVDMGVKDKDTAQIFYGLRGIAEFELKVKVAENDMHSGVYGNLVYNPVQVIANLLTKIKSDKLKINIPGFYDDVVKVSKEEIEILKKTGPYEAKIYPSFDVNGIISGFTQEGIKTIIPSEAIVKFSTRLVPNQNYKKIEKIVVDFIKKNLPKEVKYEIKTFYGSNSFYTSFENEFVKKTAQILKKYFKNEVLYNRSGGSVAASEIIYRVYKKPVILIGFINPDSNLHAPNENFDKNLFFKGIEAIQSIMNLE